jgi:predicted kinase
MQAIIFVGVQAAGKSTFYQRQFFLTHIRLSLDMLKTRHREQLLLRACLKAKQPFVVDNTNPTRAERAVYINAAKAAGFSVRGYYFHAKPADALARNALRSGKARIPDKGVLGTYKRLELPGYDEGFDQLFYVSINEDSEFVVEEWRDEV